MYHYFFNFLYEYNIATEVAMILVDVVFLFIIAFSKPEKTTMFKVLKLGLFSALMIMVLHILILGETINMRRTNNSVLINELYVLYSIFYVIEMECIFYYQAHLSYKFPYRKKAFIFFSVVLGIIWTALLIFPLLQNLVVIFDNGKYRLTSYSDAYVVCSFICGVVLMIMTIINRREVSRIVFWGSMVFIPVIIAVTLAQFNFHSAYFICATYTLPSIIYYTLFHSNKYNGIGGFQSYDAYKTFLTSCLKNKKKFLQVYLNAPKLHGRDVSEINDVIQYVTNTFCHEIEKINRRLRIYNLSPNDYVIICPVVSNKQAEIILKKVLMIVNNRIQVGEISYKLLLNILISNNFEDVSTVNEYLAIVEHKQKSFQNLNCNQIIRVTEEDVKKYKRYALIERTLLEIKHNNNLNDKRVLLYVQPIYNIQKKEFRTGESLMRMEIDGSMIYPDEFIPIAESIGCIHSLTRIILYKVARLSVKMNELFDYDALTVNVSTIEMTSPSISDEFMGIITRAKAKPENIRMEITESTNISDYKMVINNIIRLKEMGISFYLDDFGTGYSNMDRMLSIPFRTIKFDKSLLYKAMENAESDELFQFLAKYFKKHGLSLVVEGVEDEKQIEYVTAAGFDYIQGYYFSKPQPEADALKFFKKK